MEVTPNSACGGLCINNPQSNPAFDNSSYTLPPDVVCNDWELAGDNSTAAGRKFKECLLCESTSSARDVSSDQNDVYWFLCIANHLSYENMS